MILEQLWSIQTPPSYQTTRWTMKFNGPKVVSRLLWTYLRSWMENLFLFVFLCYHQSGVLFINNFVNPECRARSCHTAWETITNGCINFIANNNPAVVFLLCGSSARLYPSLQRVRTPTKRIISIVLSNVCITFTLRVLCSASTAFIFIITGFYLK